MLFSAFFGHWDNPSDLCRILLHASTLYHRQGRHGEAREQFLDAFLTAKCKAVVEKALTNLCMEVCDVLQKQGLPVCQGKEILAHTLYSDDPSSLLTQLEDLTWK